MGLGFGRRDEGRRRDGGAGVHQRRGKKAREERGRQRRTAACCLIVWYRGITAQYQNTAPAGGSVYAPDVAKGKRGRTRIAMANFQ